MIKLRVKSREPIKKIELYEFPQNELVWVVIDEIDDIKIAEIVPEITKYWKKRNFKVLITSTAIEEIQLIEGYPENKNDILELRIQGNEKIYKFSDSKIAWVRINEKFINNVNSLVSELIRFFDEIGFEALITSSDKEEIEMLNGDIVRGGMIK